MPGYITSTWNEHTIPKIISSNLPIVKDSARCTEQRHVKGKCVLCQEPVTSLQPRDKLGNGTYRHHVDEAGRCITASTNNKPIFMPPVCPRDLVFGSVRSWRLTCGCCRSPSESMARVVTVCDLCSTFKIRRLCRTGPAGITLIPKDAASQDSVTEFANNLYWRRLCQSRPKACVNCVCKR